MKKTLLALLILFLPLTASAQFTTAQGGTGVKNVAQGSILFGSSAPTIRMATSSVFQWNDTLHRLSFTYGSTTAISATTICLVGDTCRTTWPSGTGTVTSIATNNGLTGGTITTTGTIGLAAINAGVLGASTNSTVPTSQATSTLYGGASTGGFVLQWSNATGGLVLAATSSAASTGAPFPFTPNLYNTQAVVATSTGVWFTGSPLSLISSSTFSTYASTSLAMTLPLKLYDGSNGAGTNGFVLTLSAGIPTWAATSSINNGVTSITATSPITRDTATGAVTIACSTCNTSNATVSSIATNNGLTGGTITTTGTIGLATIAANTFLANATGATAVPSAVATSSFFSATAGLPTIPYASSTAESTTGPIFAGTYLSVASSTPWAFFSVNPTAGVASNEFVVGSSTATAFLINNAGNTAIGSSSPYFRLTLDRNLGVASSSIFVHEYTPTATSTAMTVDCHDSNTIHISIGTSATTLTLAAMQGGQSCVVIVSNPNGVAGALTWASASGQHIYWAAGGTVPTQTTTANARDIWSFKGDEWLALATTTPGISIIGAATLNVL